MNNFFKQMNAFVLCAIVIMAMPTYSTENLYTVANEEIELIVGETAEQKPVTVWYKKRSVQLATAVTTAAAIYAYAVHAGKISVSALLAGLFVAKVTQDLTNLNVHNDNSKNNDVAPQNQQSDNQLNQNDNNVLTEDTPKVVETKIQLVNRWDLAKQIFSDLVYRLPQKAQHITIEDLHEMNESQQQ